MGSRWSTSLLWGFLPKQTWERVWWGELGVTRPVIGVNLPAFRWGNSAQVKFVQVHTAIFSGSRTGIRTPSLTREPCE